MRGSEIIACLLMISVASQFTASELQTSSNEFDRVSERHYLNVPPYHDEWCKYVCNSRTSCSSVFLNDTLDLRMKTRYSALDGPGQHLFQKKRVGNTIARETFDTQFIIDISNALDISPCKLYVKEVAEEDDSDGISWDVGHVFISFQLFNTSFDKVQELTRQSQDKLSTLYKGEVTKATDILYGVAIPQWDFSLKLLYHIDIVGGDQVHTINNERVINKGGSRWCEDMKRTQSLEMSLGDYCEFEMYFRQDLATALFVEAENIDVLFVKSMGEDAVIVSFRFVPAVSIRTYNTKWATEKANDLSLLVDIPDSILYQGNVTFRVDPIWAVSKESLKKRTDSKRLSRSTRSSPSKGCERCKDTQRCSRAWSHYNDSEASSSFTMQTYTGGLHTSIPYFTDFENWQKGTAQWISSRGRSSPLTHSKRRPKGAHWSPFDFKSVGLSTPSNNGTANSGLVLNLHRKQKDLKKQIAWIQEIEAHLKWIEKEKNITSLDAKTRSRNDIKNSLSKTYNDVLQLLAEEQMKHDLMAISPCELWSCELLFNTSSLEMTGVMNAIGEIGLTPDGTEVAIWTFDSIELAGEVKIELVGQRAMALLSKSSVYIDTSLIARPGTLGGFPGGYSTFRKKKHRLVSVCDPEAPDSGISTLSEIKCGGDHPLSRRHSNTISNNVNGPGSPSARIYSFKVQTTAKFQHEIQSLKIDAEQGQTLGGGFILHYNNYSSPFLQHDFTALKLKNAMQDTLNVAKPNILQNVDRRNTTPGIGNVSVSRFQHGTSGGFEWRITFETAIGDVGGVDSSPLTLTNLLNGIGATADIVVLQNGTTIGGSFTFEFMGIKTRPMPHNIPASKMKRVIIKDIPLILNADISRTDANDNCNDGFCRNGSDQTGGYAWEISIATDAGNISPYSPTSSQYDSVGIIEDLIVHNNLTGCVKKECPKITSILVPHTPYSMSFGGGGGSFGAEGGIGFGNMPVVEPYGDELMTNLHGGSGGALGFVHPHDIHMIGIPARARGGSGGGAIEIVAQNDIVLGTNSILSCVAENGWGSYMTAGGGGSGGSILLAAGGTINVSGILRTKGGNGGIPSQPRSISTGGGGSGGRIAIWGESITFNESHIADVSGGSCRDDEGVKTKCKGSKGTIHTTRELEVGYSIDNTTGAMLTDSSLHLFSYWDKTFSSDKSWLQGPKFTLQESATPERVSFFIKLECKDTPSTQGWETLLFLSGINTDAHFSGGMGLAFGTDMKHGVIEKGGTMDIKKNMIIFKTRTRFGHWYKVDIEFDWEQMEYSMHLDDYNVVTRASFLLASVDAISVSLVQSNVDTWIDEIFVGNDARLGFRCPTFESGGAFDEATIRLRDLVEIDDGGESLWIWYGEHHNLSKNGSFLRRGGIVACSSKDLKMWKNEGIMLHALNVTDMVTGSLGPFHIERPKILQNKKTGTYVMWMNVDNANRTLGMTGVATSHFPNGPFSFVRSFYPDGKKTRDQIVFVDSEGTGFLIRTSYETTNYVLPSPVRQPMWESVKNKDGSTNYPLTYHRAHYESGYDDYHDIYLQRWRGEDKPWKVLCINRITNAEREIPHGAKGDELCLQQFEYKKVVGQGDPSHEYTKNGIRSKFLDPNDPLNSYWRPSSVSSVQSHSWKNNYEAGTCGIKSVHDNIQSFDPDLSNHQAKDKSQCSNIADNPIHSTPPDRLDGRPQVVHRRRANFIVVSELTHDFLDTASVLSKFEGKLEDGADLNSIVQHAKKTASEWESNGSISHTSYESQDLHPYFHQSFKSLYSIECVIDGTCPINT